MRARPVLASAEEAVGHEGLIEWALIAVVLLLRGIRAVASTRMRRQELPLARRICQGLLFMRGCANDRLGARAHSRELQLHPDLVSLGVHVSCTSGCWHLFGRFLCEGLGGNTLTVWPSLSVYHTLGYCSQLRNSGVSCDDAHGYLVATLLIPR